jgi:hypothetical protein
VNARISFVVLVWLLLMCVVVSWNASAHARDVNQHGNAYDVTLICPQLAEDSAANVRLVTYEHSDAPHSNTVIVYRCKRYGY